MARRFAYVSLGILCVTGAHQIGAGRACADWAGQGQIVGACGSFVYAADGSTWRVGTAGWERWDPSLDLPVPSGQVKLLTVAGSAGSPASILITTTDELWAFHGYANEWQYVGAFPGSPVTATPDSWGKVKQIWRK